MSLPALKTPVREMVDALERVGGNAAVQLLSWAIDPPTAKIVATWPGDAKPPRANKLRLKPDEDFDAVVREDVRENPHAAQGFPTQQ